MADGVPPLLNPPAVADEPALMTEDDPSVSRSAAPKWGVFAHGSASEAVIEPDSIVTLEFKNDSRLSQYPQEDGAFQTYNKVATPFELHVTMTKGGTESDRAFFIAAVEENAQSLALLDVVTPEKTYLSVNISRINYRRSASSGLGLITVDIGFTEIRETVGNVFASSGIDPVVAASAASPGANDPKDAGVAQPQPAPAAIAADIQETINSFTLMGGA